MKRIFLLLPLVFLLGCDEVKPISTRAADDNPSVTVEFVATFDGIRLYRVWTGTRIVYIARTSGGVATNWMEQEGKIQVPNGVQTVER